MSRIELEALLIKLGDGTASEAEIERVSELMAREEEDGFGEQLGDAIRFEAGGEWSAVELDDEWSPLSRKLTSGLADEAGSLDIADAVLAAIEAHTEVPVAEAVRDEAGVVDVSAEVLAALEAEALFPVAEAIRDEAGAIDVTDAVLVAIHAEAGLSVADAVRGEAGTVDVAPAVLTALGDTAAVPVADAVRAEAGHIDVVDDVMRTLRRSSLGHTATPPAPANTRSAWMRGAIAFAAALVVAVVGGNALLIGEPGLGDYDLQFASADEIIVDDLDYGDTANVQIYQSEGENEPLIIWVDEEVTS